MYDPLLDDWQILPNITIPRDLTFSQALSIPDGDIYLTCKLLDKSITELNII